MLSYILDKFLTYVKSNKSAYAKLPAPGNLVKVRRRSSLTINDCKQKLITFVMPGELLIVIYVDLNPPFHLSKNQNLHKPVELYFLNKEGVLMSTGTRSSSDVLSPYEVL